MRTVLRSETMLLLSTTYVYCHGGMAVVKTVSCIFVCLIIKCKFACLNLPTSSLVGAWAGETLPAWRRR